MIIVRGKLGTHSTNVYTIRGSKKPIVGDIVKIRSKHDYRCSKWIDAKVTKTLPEMGDYFFFDCV
jgi:hypothetical protein